MLRLFPRVRDHPWEHLVAQLAPMHALDVRSVRAGVDRGRATRVLPDVQGACALHAEVVSAICAPLVDSRRAGGLKCNCTELNISGGNSKKWEKLGRCASSGAHNLQVAYVVSATSKESPRRGECATTVHP